MKKLLCLALIFLVSCSAAPDPTQILRSTQEKLSAGCSFDLQFSTGEEASLCWSAEEQSLCFSAPEAIEGLCYVRDGGGLTVTFEGISARISPYALPEGAAAGEIYEAVDMLLMADAESLDCETETDGLLKISTQSSPRGLPAPRNSQKMQSAWIDTESCLPIAVKTEHWDAALALHNPLCYTKD